MAKDKKSRIKAALRGARHRQRPENANLAKEIAADRVRSGAALVAFFRASPLVGEDLVFTRDRSPGRKIDL